VKDENGRIVSRTPPPRRFRLAYLLTAWTQRPEDEHRILAALLSTFLRHDQIPGGMLAGALADSEIPVLLQLALPPPQDRSLSDVWSALGGEMKPSLDLVAVAPIDPLRTIEVGPPVLEAPGLRVARTTRDDGVVEVTAGDADEPGRTLRVTTNTGTSER
jgi:Pvc16 N-terminal domain